jgi:hypothetical protein
MIYSQKRLSDVLPIAYVDNDNYEYINVDTIEDSYVHPADNNYNFNGFGNLQSTVEETINVVTKLHRNMTDIMLNGDDWDDQDQLLRNLFVNHGASFHERLHANANLVNTLCSYIFDEHNRYPLTDFIKYPEEPTNQHQLYTDMFKLFELHSRNSGYRSVSWWVDIKKYLKFIIDVYEQYGVLPIFNHDVVGYIDNYVSVQGDYYHKDSDDVVYSDYSSEYEWREHCNWVESESDWINSEYLRWCDDCEEYFLEENDCNCQECRDAKERINEYHCSPKPEYKGKLSGNTTYNPPTDLKNLERFTIGFEVEKRNINGYNDEGDPVNIQPFFAGWECDSSCGVEGISHIYSLDDFTHFKQDTNRSHYLDSEVNSNCGGHINIVDTRNQLQYWHLTPWMGIMYSLYRGRLNKTYCNHNKKLNPYQKNNSHYNVIAEKRIHSNTLYELRMPSAVKSIKQIQTRYLIMQHIMQSVLSFMEEDFSYTTYTYDHDKEFCPDPNVSHMVSEYFQNECYYDESEPVILNKPTYKRSRYIIEQLWHILTDIYDIKSNTLTEIVFYTYLFQHWLDGNMDISQPQSIRKFLAN